MPFSPINTRFAEEDRNRENRGRLAFAHHRAVTTGQGTYEFPSCIDFGLTFIERPFIMTGWQTDLEQARDALGLGQREDILLPQVTAYVTGWRQTSREHYTGAWVAVSVSIPTPEAYPPDTPIKIFHDFTWAAVAIKDVPYQLSE